MLLAAAVIAVAPLFVYQAALNGYPFLTAFVYLPPLLVYGFLLYLFASTLRSGQTPLISVLAKRFHGRLSPQSVLYTRRITQAWAALFSLILLELILFALFLPVSIWTLYVNVFNFMAIGVFFLAEFWLRRYCVTDVRHMRLAELLRFLKQTNFGSKHAG